jgi:hypothetical protein
MTVVPEPYRTLAILLLLPMFFSGLVWLVVITRTHTHFSTVVTHLT